MLEEIALPLAERYPDDAWELLWGYDQQVFLATRAAAAMQAEAREALGRPGTAPPVRGASVGPRRDTPVAA
jgi:hypothetical protein